METFLNYVGDKFGFNAILVCVLLYGGYRMAISFYKEFLSPALVEMRKNTDANVSVAVSMRGVADSMQELRAEMGGVKQEVAELRKDLDQLNGTRNYDRAITQDPVGTIGTQRVGR